MLAAAHCPLLTASLSPAHCLITERLPRFWSLPFRLWNSRACPGKALEGLGFHGRG